MIFFLFDRGYTFDSPHPTLLTPFFGNCLFAYHPVLNNLQQNVLFSSFCIPKVIKSVTENFENQLTNKIFYRTRAFSIVKARKINIFPDSFSYLFVLNAANQDLWITSLVHAKYQVKIIFGRIFF